MENKQPRVSQDGLSRGKYKIRDTEKRERYEPVYEAYKWNIYELLLTPKWELMRRTNNGMEHESVFPWRYVVVHSTWLFDKNWVEIYGEDIVIDYNTQWEKQFFVIWWEDGGFILIYKWRLHEEDMSEFEVIWNIFENPELLEATTDHTSF